MSLLACGFRGLIPSTDRAELPEPQNPEEEPHELARSFSSLRNRSQRVVELLPAGRDLEAAVIGKHVTQLKHLEIRFSKLSAKGLTSICDGCVELECLDLSGCTNLKSRDILNASENLKSLKGIVKPNFYIPRSVFHTERYGHWRLYDERFQTDSFRI